MLMRFLFGDDVFISYARRDGAGYAAALANKLSKGESRLSCFLDQWGASASSELSAPVARALRRSRVLVLVGTPGVAASTMVRQEVAQFSSQRRWTGHRPILPLNVGGGLDHVTWTELTGLHRVAETHDAGPEGPPSAAVVRLIRDSCAFTTRNQRTRLLSVGAAAFLLVSTVAGIYAADRANAARVQERLARENAARAQDEARKADQQRGFADEYLRQAKEQEARALANARRADDQLLKTEQQTRLAVSRELAARAALLVEQGNRLPEGVRAAVRALEVETGVAAPEGYQALRQGLAVLPRLESQIPHQNGVRFATLSRDGGLLATADTASVVRIWSTAPARLIASRNYGRGVFLTGLALSPDAARVAVGYSGTLDVLRVPGATGGTARTKGTDDDFGLEARLTLRQPERPVFSPDGRYLAAIGYGGGVARTWSVDGWKEAGDVSGGANAIGFDATATFLFVFGRDALRATAVGSRAPVPAGSTPMPRASVVAFSPDGLYAAAASETSVRAWQWVSASHEWRASATITHQGRVAALAVASNGSLVCAGSGDGTARVWTLADQREVLRLTHAAGISAVTFSADGRRIATAGEDRVVRLWETAPDVATRLLRHPADVRALAFPADQHSLWTAAEDGGIRRWDTAEPAAPRNLESAPAMSDGEIPYTLLAAALDPSARFAALAVSDGTVFVANLDGSRTTEFQTTAEATAIAVSPHGDLVAIASDEGVSLWTVRDTPSERSRIDLQPARALSFSANGRWLAAGGDGGVVIWDTSRDRQLRTSTNLGGVSALAFGSTGSRLALAGEDGQLRVWDWQTRPVPALVTRAAGRVGTLALSVDNRYLSYTLDGRITPVWDLVRHREVVRAEHDAEVMALAFSQDGRQLATASRDRMVRVWLWRPEDLIAEANRRLAALAQRSAT